MLYNNDGDVMERFLQQIMNQVKDRKNCLIAIDGRCASGKTTLSSLLEQHLGCAVIHTDDFFMPIQKRSANFMDMIGGHIEQERFKKEIILPLQKHQSIIYKKFDCQSQSYLEQVEISNPQIVVIEGTYSFLLLKDMIDIPVFLTIDSTMQRERIVKRNGQEGLKNFEDIWIPLEERYFASLELPKDCVIING